VFSFFFLICGLSFPEWAKVPKDLGVVWFAPSPAKSGHAKILAMYFYGRVLPALGRENVE
jgi:hypothetical protein